MKLYQLWLANIAVLALLKFYYMPRLQRYINHQRSIAVIRKAATLAIASWIASIVLIASISGGLVLAVSLLVQMGTGATAEQVGGLITSVQRWRDRVGGFGPEWGSVVLIASVLGLGIHARWRGRIRMLKAFEAVRQAEIDRLKREAASGHWADLPPTKEMAKASERIQELVALKDEIRPEVMGEAAATEDYHRLVQQIEAFQGLYAHLDLQRRIDLRISPEAASLPEPRTWVEKVQAFFISQGLWKSLGGPSRVLYVTNLLLLIPSLLGIYSQAAAPLFDQRLLQLADLQVELTQKEAREAWQQATFAPTPLKPAEPESSPVRIRVNAQEARVLNLAAREFENALARSELFKNIAQSVRPEAERAVRSARARDRVLHVAADQAPGSVVQVPSGAQAEAGLKRSQWEYVERSTGLEPITKPGREMAKELEAYAERTPGFLENFLHSFQMPIHNDELAVSAVRQTIGALFGDHLGEFGKVLDGLDPQVELAMRNAVEIRAQSYVTEVIHQNGRNASEALATAVHPKYPDITPLNLDRFQSFGWHNPIIPDGGNGLIASIHEHPPAIDPKIDLHTDISKAAEQIRRILPSLDSSASPRDAAELMQQGTEALADFSTHFPASAQTAMKTAQIQAIEKVTTEMGGSESAGAWESVGRVLGQVAEGLAQNARSFVRLRGFSRVGGVLIGQDPLTLTNEPADLSNALHCRDVRWEVDGSRMRMILVDSTGHELVSRWWRTSIAGQALAYAADGRPLAATMVSAKPLRELKILVHAALIDTGLGQRITDLDRFVDEFTGNETRNAEVAAAREKATMTVYAQNALYAYAWAQRAKAITSIWQGEDEYLRAIARREGVDERALSEFLKRTGEEADQIIRDSEPSGDGNGGLSLAAEGFADGLAVLEDATRSPLEVKKEFFEPMLVDAMVKARPEAETLTEFGKKIRASFESQHPDLDALEAQPPGFTVWSGVREKRFRLVPEDFFVTEGMPLPSALDFMLQVSFTSNPNVSEENYADTQPWEFPALHDKIYTTVTDCIKADPRAQAIYDAATEFTLLQRFFRLGFEGFLGDEFPVEKFGELATELQPIAPPAYTRTLRWNARLGSLEGATLQSLQREQQYLNLEHVNSGKAAAVMERFFGPMVEALDEFETTVDEVNPSSATSAADWSAKWNAFTAWRKRWLDQWETKVTAVGNSRPDLSADPQTDRLLTREIDYLEKQTAAMRLRESLGLEVDDEQILRESVQKTLPPLDRF
jgi:hypothetical protein